ncbi:MAG: exonuclease domain-containing protein [Geminicoccaceae bacterium]
MDERFGLRLRFFLFFALIGLGSVAIIAVAMGLASRRIGGEALPHLVLFGGTAAFAITGLCLWVWAKFDDNVAKPIVRLSRDLHATTHGGAKPELDEQSARYLGFLAPAAQEIADALSKARSDVDQAVNDATGEVRRQTKRFEALLRDMEQGILICTLDHRVLLYNRHALEILHIAGDLGLGRSLFEIVTPQPFQHALERLTTRFDEDRNPHHGEGLCVSTLCERPGGRQNTRQTIQGRMSLFLDVEGSAPVGYVATFSDATREIEDYARRDALLTAATVDLRRPATSLLAAAEILADGQNLDRDARWTLQRILVDEATSLAAKLQQLEAESSKLAAGPFPMSDVSSTTLFRCVRDRGAGAELLAIGEPFWLYGDSLTLVALLDCLIRKVTDEIGESRPLTFEAVRESGRVYLEVSWKGQVVENAVLDRWLDEPVDGDRGGISGLDILDRHKAELWCTPTKDGGAKLRLPLMPAREHRDDHEVLRQHLLARPEFYDFDLIGRMDPTAIDDAPLKELAYVVFDTETTGLEPSAGDEIISIAGIRVLNGRVLSGETFDQLVNPGRNVPAASTKIHGITSAMVEAAPMIDEVLPRFRKFVGDAVLVAHNAAFDMKFLTLKQDACGVRFDSPVLDTVLLAAHIHGAEDSLTLDALAERYGIALEDRDRHTALGDSIATAEVLTRLTDLLDAAGISTLRQAMVASSKMMAIRRQQSKY